MVDWQAILSRIPEDVPRTHHGRTPAEGFDCVGLVLHTYHEAGFDLSDIDLDYADGDEAEAINQAGIIQALLATKLRDVTNHVERGLDEDGDIWIVHGRGLLHHAAIQCQGTLWHMSDKLHQPVRFALT